MDEEKTEKKPKLDFTKNEKWIRKMADKEEEVGCVSVGGMFYKNPEREPE